MPAVGLRDVLGKLEATDPRYATEVVDRVLAEAKDGCQRRALPARRRRAGAAVADRRRLQPVALLPAKVAPNVVARLKVLAELLTYRTDVPQEGRIRGVPGEVEMRLCTFPTFFGEKAVVRMFAGPGRFLRLDDLGLPGEVRDELSHVLDETSGAIILAGPAGSGKTTTIYACLRELAARSRGERSLATLEDPIESVVPGVAQAQVNPAAGLTLESGLKSLLRQDPEVIAIGEIRDKATAEIALQAALTGHLILTTFHAGSACEVIGRLLDMGIEPYAIRSGLRAVVAQRLVRRLCDCAAAIEPARRLPRPAGAPGQGPARLRGLPRDRLPRPHRAGRDAPARIRRAGRAILARADVRRARADRRRGRHDPPLGARLRGRRGRPHLARRGPPHPRRRQAAGPNPCRGKVIRNRPEITCRFTA